MSNNVATIETLRAEIAQLHQRIEELEQQANIGYTLMHRFPNGFVFLFDHDLRYVEAKGQALTRLGINPSTMVGKSLWDVVPPELCDRLEPLYRSALHGDQHALEISFGAAVFEIYILPLYNAQGQIETGMVIAYDITELRQTSEALHKNQALFQGFLNHLPAVLFARDTQGRFILVNHFYEKLLNLSHDEIIGKTAHEILPAESADLFRENDRIVMESGKPLEREEESPIGTYMAIKFPIYDEEGSITAVGGVSTDISQLKKVERDLREQQELLRGITENSSAAIFVKDIEGRYLLVNQRFAALIGREPAQIIGKYESDLFSQQAVEQGRSRDKEVLAARQALQFEETVPIDGTEHTFLSIAFPLFNRPGNIYALGGIINDITTLKQAERERTDFQQRVIEAQRMALRELSTPLIPIADHVVIMPLIGTIDSVRAQQMLETLLEGVATHQASTVILDITGVQIVDTQVANAFIEAARAVQLLGAHVLLTGIGPQIAQTLVQLGVSFHGLTTYGSLQAGIAAALKHRRR
jgi:PAS domain S-box-containing protein